jgi:hypothetical protein
MIRAQRVYRDQYRGRKISVLGGVRNKGKRAVFFCGVCEDVVQCYLPFLTRFSATLQCPVMRGEKILYGRID